MKDSISPTRRLSSQGNDKNKQPTISSLLESDTYKFRRIKGYMVLVIFTTQRLIIIE